MSSQEPVVHGPPSSKQKLPTRMRRLRMYSGVPKLRALLSSPFGSTGCITLTSLMSVYGRDGVPSARFPLCRHGSNYVLQDTPLLTNQLSDEYSPLWSAGDNQWEGPVGTILDEHRPRSWQQCRGLLGVFTAPPDPHNAVVQSWLRTWTLMGSYAAPLAL